SRVVLDAPESLAKRRRVLIRDVVEEDDLETGLLLEALHGPLHVVADHDRHAGRAYEDHLRLLVEIEDGVEDAVELLGAALDDVEVVKVLDEVVRICGSI